MAENEVPDRRVRRTRAAVRAALTGLIQEKGYESVTVTDIIERADIGRSTFYAHFRDKRDVFEDTVADLAHFLQTNASAEHALFSFSPALFAHMAEQRDVVRAIFGAEGNAPTRAAIGSALREFVEADLSAHGARFRPGGPPPDLTVDVVVSGYLTVVRWWIDQDFAPTPRQLDAAFRTLVLPGLRGVLASTEARSTTSSTPASPARPFGSTSSAKHPAG
jgi:AcrR family transcriptional regulator